MPFQLHYVLEMFFALFALEGSCICMFSQVLIVVSLIGVTVVTLATFVHNSTMGTFVFYQVAFVSEVLSQKGSWHLYSLVSLWLTM